MERERLEFEPILDFILIRPLPQGQTRGGIALPDGADVDPPKGLVVAAGPGRKTEYGAFIENCVQAGETVYLAFSCQQAGKVSLGGK